MKLIIFIFLLFSIKVYCQDTVFIDVTKLIKSNSSDKFMPFDEKELLAKFVKKRVDSLESYKSGNFPFFVSKYNLDYDERGLWGSLHTPISLRKMIFDSVKNKNVLIAIIKSKNEIYRRKSKELFSIYGNPGKIVGQDKSNWDLANERLKVLK